MNMVSRSSWNIRRRFASSLLLAGALPALAGGPLVDLEFDPAIVPVAPLYEFEIDLVASTTGPGSVAIATIDAILTWDPFFVDLLSVVPAPGVWFAAGFLPDPDGVNADLHDGNALFVALAPPGLLPSVPPDLVCATFRFRAVGPLGTSIVQLLPQTGTFARTRVLGQGIQNDVTGSIAGASTSVIVAPLMPGDMNCDGFVTVGDIAGFVLALTNPAGYLAAYPMCNILNGDVNGDMFVTVGDIGPFVGLITGG